MRILVLSAASLFLGGCYSGSLRGDEGPPLRLGLGWMVVCETPTGSTAAYATSSSLNTCPHQLDTSEPQDTDTGDDTGPTVIDTGDTGITLESTEEEGEGESEGGVCDYLSEFFAMKAFCEPWQVQTNDPTSAHTFNVWFEDVPEANNLKGARASEAILAQCPDPNGIEPTTATSLQGDIEVTRDNGRKATIKLDTNKGQGKLKLQVCR